MTDPISVDLGTVTTIAVDRPEAMNALTIETIDALEDREPEFE
jgi:enoyl-CoA hydratase/carnithine racemase